MMEGHSASPSAPAGITLANCANFWKEFRRSGIKSTALIELLNNSITVNRKDVPEDFTLWNGSKISIQFHPSDHWLEIIDNGIGIQNRKEWFTFGHSDAYHRQIGSDALHPQLRHQNVYGVGSKPSLATLFHDVYVGVACPSGDCWVGRTGSTVAEKLHQAGRIERDVVELYDLDLPNEFWIGSKCGGGAEGRLLTHFLRNGFPAGVDANKVNAHIRVLIEEACGSPYAQHGEQSLEAVLDLLKAVRGGDSGIGNGSGTVFKGWLYDDRKDELFVDENGELCIREGSKAVLVRRLFANSLLIGNGPDGWHPMAKELLFPNFTQRYCGPGAPPERHTVDIVVQNINMAGQNVLTGHISHPPVLHPFFDLVDRVSAGDAGWCSPVFTLQHTVEFNFPADPSGKEIARGMVVVHDKASADEAGMVLVAGLNVLNPPELGGPSVGTGWGTGVAVDWLKKYKGHTTAQYFNYHNEAKGLLDLNLLPFLSTQPLSSGTCMKDVLARRLGRTHMMKLTFVKGAMAIFVVNQFYLPVGRDKRSVQQNAHADVILPALVNLAASHVYKHLDETLPPLEPPSSAQPRRPTQTPVLVEPRAKRTVKVPERLCVLVDAAADVGSQRVRRKTQGGGGGGRATAPGGSRRRADEPMVVPQLVKKAREAVGQGCPPLRVLQGILEFLENDQRLVAHDVPAQCFSHHYDWLGAGGKRRRLAVEPRVESDDDDTT